jgi:predicted transcriptional regulator
MADTPEITLRPDAKGRVALGKLAEGISSFRATQNVDGSIVLKPYVEIALKDSWLARNPEALASVQRGLEDLKAGRVHDLGDFTQFIADEDDAAA